MVSWEYIAGFFDGEGHVGLGRQKHCGDGRFSRGSPRLSMVQSLERGRVLLEEIQEFFLSHGIPSTVGLHNDGNTGCRRSYHLRITGFRGVVPALVGMLPYLHIKKVEAQDLIRYDKAFPTLVGRGHSHSENVRMSWESRRKLYGGTGYRNPDTPREHGRIGANKRWNHG